MGYEARMEAAGDYAAEVAAEMVRDGAFSDDLAEQILEGNFDDVIADYLDVVQIVHCPYCGKVWCYNGRDEHYATCVDCKKKVRLHPYLKRGYANKLKLKFPNNRNYKLKRVVKRP